MSVYVTAWVWKQETGDAEAKLILLKLADQANDDGICWPSRRTIARDCETSVSTVQRSINYLVDRGYISIEHRRREDGSRTSSIYRFAAFTTQGPSDTTQGHSDPTPSHHVTHPQGPSDSGGGVSLTHHEPSSSEPVSESSLNQEQIRWDETEDERAARIAENTQRLAAMRKELGL
jgi:DNA-binding transcriptional MocR family regulator